MKIQKPMHQENLKSKSASRNQNLQSSKIKKSLIRKQTKKQRKNKKINKKKHLLKNSLKLKKNQRSKICMTQNQNKMTVISALVKKERLRIVMIQFEFFMKAI